jgi:uncharacterized membrane protein YhaH (DUF805 family)
VVSVSFGQAISSGFRNYAVFSGRASRSEYWWWILFVVLVGLATGAIWDGLGTAWNIAVLLPSLGLGVRRLRDAGYHWGWIFLSLVPIVGSIVLIVFLTQPSKPVENDVPQGRVEPEL